MADQGVVDEDLCFRKALAAATKAYSLHSLPIYMFDMGCIFEMLGDTTSAQGAFRSFLECGALFHNALTGLDDGGLRVASRQFRNSEHKAEHTNCRMRGDESDLRASTTTVSSWKRVRAARTIHLLNRYTGQNLYRGFESLSLRHCFNRLRIAQSVTPMVHRINAHPSQRTRRMGVSSVTLSP